nr:hypothetical protein [uncultured bacterium]
MYSATSLPGLVRPFSEKLANQGWGEKLKASYEELLTGDGVAFPTAEVSEAQRLWDAWAAEQRGAPALNDDGSQIDISGFDVEAVGNILRAHQEPLRNAEKLDTMVGLGLLSKAGSLAVANVAEKYGDDSVVHRKAQLALVDGYKQFVEFGVATEGWARPWRELVRYGFAGEPLRFPLDGGTLQDVLIVFNTPLFAAPREVYFRRVGDIGAMLMLNLMQVLERAGFEDIEQDHLRRVATVGMAYKHSPEGCEDLLAGYVMNGSLTAEVNWPLYLNVAVARTEGYFTR